MAAGYKRDDRIEKEMSKSNNSFQAKPYLDTQVDKYADYVYATFEYDRINGRMKSFGDYYYPAMVSICTDINNQFQAEGYSDSPIADEYGKTLLLKAMEDDFNQGNSIRDANTFKKVSLCGHPLGQCAEQHAANDLLQINGAENITIKSEIFFSKAVRPVNRKVFGSCDNCKKLFDM